MQNPIWDSLWINAKILTPTGLLEKASIAVKDGLIAWVGLMGELPQNASLKQNTPQIFDAKNHCITPGLIDCHTHIVYAGNRANEFSLRLQGMSYVEIAKQGGGILSSVRATRDASFEMLLEQSLPRVEQLISEGVTTIEIKSGYGLDWESEKKILKVADAISKHLPVSVFKTFLGAHVFPPEYQGRKDVYVDLLCQELIPQMAEEQLADAVDVFCEKIAFNLQQTERIFTAAIKAGLKIKCHAEQLSHSGAIPLAVQYQALSVDHLEFATIEDAKLLSSSNTVAVLLPGAYYFLREQQKPPIDLFRQYKIPMALATDCNPGTSPLTSLLLAMNMACTQFGLTTAEALLGVTEHAAQALGIENQCGSLVAGKTADFVIWDISHPYDLPYYMGFKPAHKVVKGGKLLS